MNSILEDINKGAPGSRKKRKARKKTNKSQWWSLFTDILDDPSLNGRDKIVMAHLLRHSRRKIVTESIEQISKTAGCGKRSVQKSLQSLVAAGWVAVLRRGNRQRGPSTYKIVPKAQHVREVKSDSKVSTRTKRHLEEGFQGAPVATPQGAPDATHHKGRNKKGATFETDKVAHLKTSDGPPNGGAQ